MLRGASRPSMAWHVAPSTRRGRGTRCQREREENKRTPQEHIAWMWAPKFCELSLQTSRCSNKAWKVCGRLSPSQFGKYIARKSPGGGGFARTCHSSASAPEIEVASLKISFWSMPDSVSITCSGAARRGATAGAKRALAVVAAHTSPRITRGRAIAQARCVRVSGFSTSSFTTSKCVYAASELRLQLSVFFKLATVRH